MSIALQTYDPHILTDTIIDCAADAKAFAPYKVSHLPLKLILSVLTELTSSPLDLQSKWHVYQKMSTSKSNVLQQSKARNDNALSIEKLR